MLYHGVRTPIVAVGLVAAVLSTGIAAARVRPQGSIVFSAYVASTNSIQLFRERADGSGRVRLTNGAASYDEPRWSPDGKTVLAVGPPGLVILTPTGHVLRRIRVRASTFQPRWSPDGKTIAFLGLRCDDPLGKTDPSCADLWIVRADGTARRRLGPPQTVDAAQGLGTLYSWSPDSTRIAYVGRRGIVVVDVASRRTRPLGPATALIEQYPRWSPDGRRILFARQRGSGKDSDLVLIPPAGGAFHRVPGTLGAFEPRWSPDGRHIAYLLNLPNESRWAVIVARPNGTSRVLVGYAGDSQVLEWSPDSTRVLFPAPRGGFEIARADGRPPSHRIPGEDHPDWH